MARLSHIDPSGNPKIVDVSDKKVTHRTARAQAVVNLGRKVMESLRKGGLSTAKGPVFQTALVAGIMAAKKTGELIPLCHPLGLEDCQIGFEIKGTRVWIHATATVTAKTGVEMEALTAATIAALTVYDMCKALSHEIVIEEIKLMEKRGGKKAYMRK